MYRYIHLYNPYNYVNISRAYTLIGKVDEEALSKDLFSVKSYIDEFEEKEKKMDL